MVLTAWDDADIHPLDNLIIINVTPIIWPNTVWFIIGHWKYRMRKENDIGNKFWSNGFDHTRAHCLTWWYHWHHVHKRIRIMRNTRGYVVHSWIHKSQYRRLCPSAGYCLVSTQTWYRTFRVTHLSCEWIFYLENKGVVLVVMRSARSHSYVTITTSEWLGGVRWGYHRREIMPV